MPDIPIGSQIFDLAFHPTNDIVYTGLLTGGIKAHSYNEQGYYSEVFELRPSKRSCRGLALNTDGSHLWAVGMAKALHTIDTTTGQIIESRKAIHEATINRVKQVMAHMVATGDDDGVIKLWDPRTPECIRTYNQHFDFISDFHWLSDKKHLIATSGDGTLSVMDVRSKKTEPFAQSEDQEDELLSMVPIKNGSKLVVGTQLGILSIFNRNKGWGDCVDRVPGHPSSIDALCALPSSYPSSNSTILTGSSDGLLRAVQLLPTKLIGIVADHGSFPIERIAIEKGGEGRWVGSVGHEEILKMTDLKDIFEDEDPDEDGAPDEKDSDDEGEGTETKGVEEEAHAETADDSDNEDEAEDEDEDESSEEEVIQERKRKRKPEKNPLAGKKKKGRNQVDAEPTFFSDL